MKHEIKTLTIVPERMDGTLATYCENAERMSWCYLHGELTSITGYDIFSVVGELPIYTGIYPVEVLTSATERTKATFFLWTCYDGFARGLVVASNDHAGIAHAQYQFETRSSIV